MTDNNIPPNWHFKYLSPVYDYFMFEKNFDVIEQVLDLSGTGRLLDLGGGTGEFCASLVERGVVDPGECFVLDLSREMLSRAATKGLPNLVAGNARQLPLRPGSFDAVFMGDTYHHMGNRPMVLQEVRRLLSPEGRLVLEEFDPSTITGKLLEWGEQISGMGSEFFTPDQLIGQLSRAGLKTESLQRDGFVYYLSASRNGT